MHPNPGGHAGHGFRGYGTQQPWALHRDGSPCSRSVIQAFGPLQSSARSSLEGLSRQSGLARRSFPFALIGARTDPRFRGRLHSVPWPDEMNSCRHRGSEKGTPLPRCLLRARLITFRVGAFFSPESLWMLPGPLAESIHLASSPLPAAAEGRYSRRFVVICVRAGLALPLTGMALVAAGHWASVRARPV